jgi:uncharacterized protein
MAIVEAVQIDLARLAREVQLPEDQVRAAVDLLSDDNTVPFISRYRRQQTGGLDEEQIRAIQAAWTQAKMLSERKQTILRSIESQGKLTDELAAQIRSADSVKRIEDLYLPFKPKKQTLADAARQRGLDPLAQEILSSDPACEDLDARAAAFVNEDQQLTSVADVLIGVGHLLAEHLSEQAELRGKLRKIYRRAAQLVSTQIELTEKQKKNEKLVKKAKHYRDYYDYREKLSRVPPHRLLAINRGEKAKILRVKVEADVSAMQTLADELSAADEHPHAEFLRACGRDALERLLVPSLEREARRELTERAESHAVEVFARNLKHLLLQPPVRGRRVLAIDPGFRNGCKLAGIDEFGNLVVDGIVRLVGKDENRQRAKQKIAELIAEHNLTTVAVGNGTACRQTEQLLSEMMTEELQDKGVSYVIVNEAGASVYSTSPLGREELPECDSMVRSAISIGRRLLDPLSELVKIEPASIGVGLYQHDVKAKHLQSSLDAVVESCVNYVGVDLNTASVALLRYVSGLNQLTARRVCEYRAEHGPFTNREQLKQVPGLGEKSFQQAAGFLKIAEADNPLDSTWIHPESYLVADAVMQQISATTAELTAPKSNPPVDGEGDSPPTPPLSERLSTLNLAESAAAMEVGEILLRDVVTQLTRPGRDPREDLPLPMFKQGVVKLEDLSPGMELVGTVLNVVDFGVFVDVGLHDTGLVHVSELAQKFVKDPHEVAAVGDIVKVWVKEVDKERRRVALSMLPPGVERTPPPRRQKKAKPDRPSGAAGKGRGSDSASKERGGKGRPAKGRHRGDRPAHGKPRTPRPPAKPKYVPPITKEMAEGTEVMRTFGDLAQFFEKKDETPGTTDGESTDGAEGQSTEGT